MQFPAPSFSQQHYAAEQAQRVLRRNDLNKEEPDFLDADRTLVAGVRPTHLAQQHAAAAI